MLKSWPRELAGERACSREARGGQGCRHEAERRMRSLVAQTPGTMTTRVHETSPTWKHTQNSQEEKCLGRHRTHPRNTPERAKPPAHTQHTPRRAKRCSVSPCPSQRTPLTNHPTNLSWVCAVYRTLPCSPAEGKACINQITTPGNDDHRDANAAAEGRSS